MIFTWIKRIGAAITATLIAINQLIGMITSLKAMGLVLPPAWLILIAMTLTLLLIATSFYLGIIYVVYVIATAFSKLVKNIPSRIELDMKPKG